jgi:hypothetical protein
MEKAPPAILKILSSQMKFVFQILFAAKMGLGPVKLFTALARELTKNKLTS